MSQISDTAVNFADTDGDGNCVSRGRIGMDRPTVCAVTVCGLIFHCVQLSLRAANDNRKATKNVEKRMAGKSGQ